MAKTFKVHIERYATDKTPASYVQTYELEYHSSQTVLEVLAEIRSSQDDSLSFRSACEAAKCGSCAVELNGNPVLACRTMVDGNDLQIGPIPTFPVVKDLIVDRERYEKGYVQTLSYGGDAGGGSQPAAALPESEIDYANLSCCIGCLVCNAACPVAGEMDEDFPSPAVIAEVLSSGVRIDKDEMNQAPIEGNIDFCSLCLNCHVACPSGVALNRINAQVKDAYVREKGRSLRDWMLGRAELAGKLGSLFPSLSNRVLQNKLVRRGMESAIGISSKAEMVPYAKPFKDSHKSRSPKPETVAAKHKVAYFLGCYTRYNDNDPGQDALVVLESLGFQVEIPEQTCCGLPLLSSGDLAAAEKKAEINTAAFQPWCDQGYEIITSCTSCSLMLKHEYTEVLGLQHAAGFADRTHDLGEYLLTLINSGKLRLDLKPVPMRAAYHSPCHLRAQKIGLPFIEILNKIPEFEVEVLNAPCCGQAGSYGFKAEKYEVSSAVGQQLSESLKAAKPEIALSECGPCQIRMHDKTGLPVAHPLSILRRAME